MNTEKRVIMNISPTMQCVNLITRDSKGNPESVIMTPRESRELTLEQVGSLEVQRLLRAKILVDVSASVERRKKAEEAASKSKTPK